MGSKAGGGEEEEAARRGGCGGIGLLFFGLF